MLALQGEIGFHTGSSDADFIMLVPEDVRIHHGICGNPPPALRPVWAFQTVRLLQVVDPLSTTFTAPFLIRPDPDGDDSFRSSDPPMLHGAH